MNSFTSLSLFICVVAVSSVVLPELHVIKRIAFKRPYGCQTVSYEDSALFITDYGVSRNMPDLLYTGACGSTDYFNVMLAGDEFGLLSDLGDVPLETLTASRAFNYDNTMGKWNLFAEAVTVVQGHTYVALLAKREIRALFVFRVENFEPSGPASIAYAVKQYGVIQSVDEAPGFSWNATNH
jgi:hypothetical protein